MGEAGRERVRATASATTDNVIVATVVAIEAAAAAPSPAAVFDPVGRYAPHRCRKTSCHSRADQIGDAQTKINVIGMRFHGRRTSTEDLMA